MKHEKLKHMLSKKRNLSDTEKHAKMNVLGHLRDMASEAMGDKLGSVKKVSVASNSAEGLQHGLDKAKQIVSSPEMKGMVDHAENPYGDYQSAMQEHEGEEMNQGGMAGYSEGGETETPDKGEYEAQDQEAPTDDEGSEAHEMSESPEEEAAEQDEFHGLDMDEIHKKLEKLMKLKAKMEGRK